MSNPYFPNPVLTSPPIVVDGREYPFAKRVVLREAEIQAKIRSMAKRIAEDYKALAVAEGTEFTWAEPLLIISVLKGSFMFTADVGRCLNDEGLPHIIDFVCVTSYAGGTKTTGEVRVLMDTRFTIANRHVLIVEDIVDSGVTLDFLHSMLMSRNPKSLRTLVFADKPMARKVPFVADYKCFDVPNEYVVGYGFELNDRFRSMRDVFILREEYYKKSNAAIATAKAAEVKSLPNSKL